MSTRADISGVFPHLAVKATHHPERTETGIGAMMPWVDRLWFVTYVAHKAHSGGGTGLFTVDDELNLEKHPASVVGTYANRMIHAESDQCIIGPHIIDTDGNVRTFDALVNVRLTGTARHLSDPESKVYMLGMEGEFYEADVNTLGCRKLADLTEELRMSGQQASHFKDIFTNHGRVVVAGNSYYHNDFVNPEGCDGRLAEWDGGKWHILARTQFNTVAGRIQGELGPPMFAFGQDRASAIMKVHLPATGWQTYRLPKATHTQDHAWTTEWPRLREVESERWLLNVSGMFYELPAMAYGDRVWGVRPICSHLRIIGDFCAWNGLLVMAGDQTTPINDSNPVAGQPQANLWFGKTDDLWQWGRPTGWGGPWWDSFVRADRASDPYLMTGFGRKCLHLSCDEAGKLGVRIEVDYRGDGTWGEYATLQCPPCGYIHHEFPEAFSAHWLRLVPDRNATATAQLFYT